jgi:hypothetical protein
MSKDTHTHPDTLPKDRRRAGRVSPCARAQDGLTKTPRFGPGRLRSLPKRRPDLRFMSFAPAAPSSWLPQSPSKGCLEQNRHANGLRLNEKSNPQEPESPRP